MEIKKFDVFIIGSGSAGQTVAEACANEGLKVAVADNHIFGGTCANRGCDPKKVLLGATEAWNLCNNLQGKGVASLPPIDWKKLQKFKRSFTRPVPIGTESRFNDLEIDVYHQSPQFIDAHTLRVEGKTVQAEKIVIATGQTPRTLNFKGSQFLKTSEDFLSLKKLPKHIVFIGAGYIAMEFAHMAARAGSKVTIIDHGKRPLKAFDVELVGLLTNVSKDMGIQFIFNSKVRSIKKLRKKLKINYLEDGEEKEIKTNIIFNTAGRVPAIKNLNLNKGNIAFSNKGIKVNNYLQSTTAPNVYACGDVSEHSAPLTPLTGMEGAVVAQNIIKGNAKKVDTPLVPSAVFTLPHLAAVGLSESAAKKRYKKVIINYQSVPHWFNSKRIQEAAYAFKIIINQRTNVIVGAHLLSGNAAETINLFAMAIHNGNTVDELKKMIFTYPSFSNDIKSML